MNTKNPLSWAIQLNSGSKAVVLSAAIASLYTVPVLAADKSVVEEVFITGSRISRDQFQSSSPMSVYDAETLLKSNAASLDEFLMKAPEFTGYALGVSTNNGNNGGKMVDLRGIGHKRTLVLINGRRQVGSFVGGSLDLGAVDLNTIPMGMVERVEVLKDGASTAYGSDAIAGVVNVILKKRFDGLQITGGLGAGTEDWDAENQDLAMTMGASSDKGGMVLGLEYHKQDELLQQDRDWAEFATWPSYNGSGFDTINQGSSNSRKIVVSPADFAIIQAADPSITSNRFIVDATTGQVRPYDAATDTYNYAAVNSLVTPNERWQMSAAGDHELFRSSTMGLVNAHGELSYTKRTSHQRLAPDASFSVTDYNGNPNEFVPASNPNNPFGDNPDNPWGVSGGDVQINRRFVESGGRIFNQNVDTFRMLFGFDGEVNNGINWDLNYVYADNSEVYETKFYHRFDRWAIAVDPDQCSADPACAAVGVLDPFGDYGSISSEQMGYLSANSLKDQYDTRMQSLTFNLTGDFAGWAGPIGWAAGYEHRIERAEIKPDEFSSGGLTTGGGLDPLRGQQGVSEFYVEFLLPLIADAPMVKALNMEISYRNSDYDTSAGNTDNYRLGLDWTINDAFRTRTVFSTGFRAPNMVEFFTQAVTFPIAENWCEFTDMRGDITDTIRANCATLGYPGDYEQGFQYQATLSQEAAPDNLGPEESETFTLGVVWTPPSIEGLQVSVDYFNLEVDDYIELPDINFLAYECLNSVNFSAAACSNFTSAYGDPDNTAIDTINVGINQDAVTPLGNLGKLTTSGIDFAVDYRMDVNFLGANSLGLSLAASYLEEFEKDFGALGMIDYVGTAGGGSGAAVYPELRYNTGVSLMATNWSVTWNMRWMDEADDLYRPSNITDDGVAEDIFYHDLIGTYAINNVDLTVGIDNVLDEEPPQFHSGFNMHTAPGVYDTIGRRAWVKATLNF